MARTDEDYYSDILNGFNVGYPAAVDKKLVLSKAEMLTAHEETSEYNMPDHYFCVCTDDSKLYVYNKDNTVDAETGKFRLADEDKQDIVSAGDGINIENNVISALAEKIGKNFTTKVAIGSIPANYEITEDMKIADILFKMFGGETVSVTGVTLDSTSITLDSAGTSVLTATVAPANATDKKVTWSSNNTSLVTVDSNGNITANSTGKVGSAAITVTTNDGGYTATCNVTVNKVAVTGISLNKTTATVTEGKSTQIVATITPTNATNKDVDWTIDDESIATVDDYGNVTGTKAGEATITATSNDNTSVSATCKLTVEQAIQLKLYKYEGTTLPTAISDSWTEENTDTSAITSGITQILTGRYKGYVCVAYPKSFGELAHIYQNDMTSFDLLGDAECTEVTYNSADYYMYRFTAIAKLSSGDKYQYLFK